MCGIAGVWRQGAEAVPAMLESIRHRGPDGGGIWRHEASGVTLGHRRLSILDHAGGAQPFAAGDDGDGGGYVVATGTPEEVAKVPESYTGQYLKPYLEQ